jgi:hypothetical protein
MVRVCAMTSAKKMWKGCGEFFILRAVHKGRRSRDGGQKVCSLYGRIEDKQRKTNIGGRRGGLTFLYNVLQDVICEKLLKTTSKLLFFFY